MAEPVRQPSPAVSPTSSLLRREGTLAEHARHAQVLHRRQMLRRGLVYGLVVGLLVLFAMIFVPVARQLGVQWSLAGAGLAVHWDLDSENWMTGGVTSVNMHVNPWRYQFKDVDLGSLSGLWNLESIKLDESFFTEKELAPLARLTTLRELSIARLDHIRFGGGPAGLGDACLVPLQKLTTLQMLVLSGNRITDAGLPMLSGLSNLEMLELQATDVSDAGLVHLHPLRNLRVLNLAGTRVTPEGVRALQMAMPWLSDVNMTVDAQLAESLRAFRRANP